VVLRILKAGSSIKPAIAGEKIVMNIKVDVAADILESEANIDFQQNEAIDKVQDSLEEKVKKQIIAAINKSKRLKSDVFGFGNYFFGKYPKYWEQIEANWYDYYPDIDVNIEVNAKVNHTGLSRK
jgi:spore germination protein KC